MIDGKFNIVFRGQVVKTMTLDEVKANLVKLFKSTPQSIDKLFGGQQVTIKKNLDYAAAMKYQAALKKAGALALIQEVETTTAEPAPPTANNATPSTDESVADASGSQQSSGEDASDGEFSLAEVGARILPPRPVEKRDVDTSGLSVAPPGERILPPQEPEKGPVPNIDHLSIADD